MEIKTELVEVFENLEKATDRRKAQEIVESIFDAALLIALFEDCPELLTDEHPDVLEGIKEAAEEMVEEKWQTGKINEDTPLSKTWDVRRSLRQSFKQKMMNAVKKPS